MTSPSRIGRPRKCECGECRTCKNRVTNAKRYANMTLEQRRAMIARRDPETVRRNDRKRYYRDWAKRRALNDAYQKKNPAVANEGKRRWIERNPEKRRAHQLVGTALASGRLSRQPCEVCGAARVHAHHDDYSRPLVVRWLCLTHHAELHRSAA